VNKRLLLIISGLLILLLIFSLIIILSVRKAKASKPGQAEAVNPVSILLTQARDLELKGSLSEAKAIYQKLMGTFTNSGEVMNWQKKLEDLNIKLLFSPLLIPKSRLYSIKPGDTLTKIAREFGTTTDLIMKSNNLADDKIVPGRKIKVWTAPFNILVDKSQNTLILKSEEEIIKTYIIATGKDNSTPVGNFKITNKLVNPAWFKAGAVVPAGSPENILGTRWLGFNLPGYGIHGTTEPQSLGRQLTQGCVRMSNPNVEELYTIVPIGTEVTIVD
jgi:lipoprotein-anchoring transpeptidase ErfK/SrfK